MTRTRTVLLSAAAAGLAAFAARSGERYGLDGKVVLISGGGRGLGLQIAREAAHRGATLGLFARHEDELTAARDELTAAGTRVATAICDVRDAAAVASTVARLERELGAPDVLFNVAGIIAVGPIETLSLADFQEAVDINFLGALRATYAVLPGMRARRAGRIVNITSLGGAIGIPHMLPYCASKFALLGFSEGLRAEIARDGVRVVTVIPGLMRTGSPPQATFTGQTRKEYALFALSDATPLTSVSVEHAARIILDGTQRGDARVVVSWQAKVALLARGIAPGLVIGAMTLAGLTLPRGGSDPEKRSGRESESPLTQSPLTAMSRSAAEAQNETLQTS